MAIVQLEQVSRTFGPVTAVDGIDLSVERGEFLTLLGPSGCGKTTTLRMVAGLERNTHGRIAIDGAVVSDAARNWHVPPDKRRLGMVFQSYAIWPHMTVFDNVAYPLRIRRRPRDEIERRVEAALRLVEMSDYRARPAPALSGGQQQRVAIARALVFEPSVLLLDEPLSNLDAKLRTQMGDEFRALQQRLGLTTIYVTHDQDEAMALSDRIVVMQHGRILQIGDPEQIYARPATRAVAAFIGSPNLLEAEVSACSDRAGGSYDLEVTGAGWSGRCASDRPFEAGRRILVMIRPENLRLTDAAAPDGADLVWRGRVVGTVFRGARRSVTVEAPHGRVQVDAPALPELRAGDEVTLAVPRGGAWALPGEAISAA